MLLDALRDLGVEGRTFVDIGGGVGVLQHELMAAGADRGFCADASPAYLETARREATSRGYLARMTYRVGDFVELVPEVPEADIVTLDRVLCCYDDMPALVDASLSRARRVWAAVFPREERTLVRLGIRLLNFVQRLRRRPFRVFAHRRADIEARLTSRGYTRTFHGTSVLWRVLVFTRD